MNPARGEDDPRGSSRRGRRSYGGMPRFLWESRPRGDGWWSARLIATGASLLRGDAPLFVGAPPSGRWVVVCKADRDGGVAPTGGCPAFCGRPALGAMGGGLQGASRRGRRSYGEVPCYLWEPRPRGDGPWFARLYRDEGAAPTGEWPYPLHGTCTGAQLSIMLSLRR